MTQNQITYDRLNVTLTRDDVMGESLYNPMLPGIVADLKAKGLAVESEGATVVFLDEFKKQGRRTDGRDHSEERWRLSLHHH
ncbi:arginyl-tRNA synthetase [Escherichia coli]|uniref:Arginyl-tRNA synthetase n=1 Tax=Escherichia coli TaxID=562 RepID=A0A376KU90_ECOLX|nr:arginyl-tRNA synthetase [Escherichia coli]